jgi:hypothetical protein
MTLRRLGLKGRLVACCRALPDGNRDGLDLDQLP